MQKILFYIFIIIFTGCGGGGGGDSSQSASNDTSSTAQNFPKDKIVKTTSYETWDYITPNISLQNNSIKSRSMDGTEYSATFRNISNSKKIETPITISGESVEYQKLTNSIKITFKKDDKELYSYKMKKTLHIGEITTIDDSSCELVNHYDSYRVGVKYYQDVIEIDCGKHRGFYAKNIGEIFKD